MKILYSFTRYIMGLIKTRLASFTEQLTEEELIILRLFSIMTDRKFAIIFTHLEFIIYYIIIYNELRFIFDCICIFQYHEIAG